MGVSFIPSLAIASKFTLQISQSVVSTRNVKRRLRVTLRLYVPLKSYTSIMPPRTDFESQS